MVLNAIELTFVGIVGVQIIYWFVWLTGMLKLKKTQSVDNGDGISVVIAANNELANLERNLPIILQQAHSNYEVIVVDDRSSDGSYEFLLDLANSHNHLKVLSVSELPDHLNGKKYAITLGIKSAKYDQILLTDADCTPESKNWITTFASAWSERTSFVLGFSQYLKKPGLLNYFIRFETILTGIQYLAAAAIGKPYMGVGRNLSYSKSLFLAKKGFHGYQFLVGGDDDLFVNNHAVGANTKVAIGPETLTTSVPKTSWSSYLLQKTRHLSIGKHYSVKSKIILFIFTFTWILTWVLLPTLFLYSQNYLLPRITFSLRLLIMGVTFIVFSSRTGAKLGIFGLIILDIMFAVYYFVTGIRALFAKRIRWR